MCIWRKMGQVFISFWEENRMKIMCSILEYSLKMLIFNALNSVYILRRFLSA